ncbi:MAG: hypothetical protein FWE44_05495 [Defluviitaleaceae bacterium]|nr:hypothetical protein [Defluviitaleaceae bacterium]
MIATIKNDDNELSIFNFCHHGATMSFSLRVISDFGKFSATVDCLIVDEINKGMDLFVRDLNNMYDFLCAKATLNICRYGNFIDFEMNKQGQITISGELYSYGGYIDHLMRFAFKVDQTFLQDFLKSLRKICKYEK